MGVICQNKDMSFANPFQGKIWARSLAITVAFLGIASLSACGSKPTKQPPAAEERGDDYRLTIKYTGGKAPKQVAITMKGSSENKVYTIASGAIINHLKGTYIVSMEGAKIVSKEISLISGDQTVEFEF